MDLEIGNGLGTIDWLTAAQEPADLEAITAAEIGVGLSLLGADGVGTLDGEGAFAQSGWEASYNTTQAARFSTKQVAAVHTSTVWDQASLSMYWVDAAHPIYTALDVAETANDEGFIVRSPSGTATGQRYRVWPVKIIGCDLMFNFDGNPSMYVVTFALGAPSKGDFAV